MRQTNLEMMRQIAWTSQDPRRDNSQKVVALPEFISNDDELISPEIETGNLIALQSQPSPS